MLRILKLCLKSSFILLGEPVIGTIGLLDFLGFVVRPSSGSS